MAGNPQVAERMRRAATLMRARGLTVFAFAGWETRGRSSFLSPRGLVAHHTAAPFDVDAILLNGRPDVPGPLCNLALHGDGAWGLLASGRANHAGVAWLSSSESIGVEATGPKPTGAYGPAAFPYESYALGMACLVEAFDLNAGLVYGHKEIALPVGRKVDPAFDMDPFRLRIRDILAGVADGGDLVLDATTKAYFDKQFELLRVGDRAGGDPDTHDFSSIEGVRRRLDRVAELVELTRVGDQSGGETDTHDFASVEGVGRQVGTLASAIVQLAETVATMAADVAEIKQKVSEFT